jgi:hypothetical protein
MYVCMYMYVHKLVVNIEAKYHLHAYFTIEHVFKYEPFKVSVCICVVLLFESVIF